MRAEEETENLKVDTVIEKAYLFGHSLVQGQTLASLITVLQDGSCLQ